MSKMSALAFEMDLDDSAYDTSDDPSCDIHEDRFKELEHALETVTNHFNFLLKKFGLSKTQVQLEYNLDTYDLPF